MKAPSLSSISIEYFRGSVVPFKLEFDKGKNLTIIYGENGSGKSTISDAFDFLGNGKVGSLGRRGLGITQRFWPSIGKSANQVRVIFETASGRCGAGIGDNEVTVTNASLRPAVAVLRRSEILGLIEAQPADRYAQISRFVDVSSVESSEDGLRELIRTKIREYETATTRVSENLGEIERFWNQSGRPNSSAVAWADLAVQVDDNHLDKTKAAIDRLNTTWDSFAALPTRVADLIAKATAAEAAQRQAETELNSIKDSVTSDYLALLDLLKAAQAHFLKYPNPSACPLCESDENARGLADDVNRRIESQGAYTKLEAAKKTVEATASVTMTAKQRIADALMNAKSVATALELCCRDDALPENLELPIHPIPDDFNQLETWIKTNEHKRKLWGAMANDYFVDKKFIRTLRTSLTALKENEQRAKELEALLPRIRRAAELVAQERKKFTDEILSAISVRVGELYEAIHPGEGLSKIALALEAGKRASLGIATEFGGKKDAPPQAYFSDSHLDTLGLCIFLALAERDAPQNKLLILDDVLGSVDEPHVERIISMLYDVLQKFRHSIITTHYRPWREKFRWGMLKPDQTCHFVELDKWTLDKGISVSGSMIPEISRLKVLLSDPNPDIQVITSKAGVILEALLDFITLQYGCAVPRRQSNVHVLSDFLGAVNGKLLAALKAETLDPAATGQVVDTVDLKPLLEQLSVIAQTRNVIGAHFNALAFDLYPDDGIRFAKLVEQLSDALVCPEYGRPIKNAGSYWRNSGDTRRLHPLTKPN